MKLLGSTKTKITKDKNGKNVLYLEVTEVVFIVILSVIIITVKVKIQKSCVHLFLINLLINY